jgi:hypothetical protein
LTPLGQNNSFWQKIAAPKLVAGVFAAFTDYYTLQLARKVLGVQYASTAVSANHGGTLIFPFLVIV